MMSDLHIWVREHDPLNRPICPREPESTIYLEVGKTIKFPKRSYYKGPTASKYNQNFKTMPKNF